MSKQIKKAAVEAIEEQNRRVRGTRNFKMPKEAKRLAATILDRADRRAYLNAVMDSLVNQPQGKRREKGAKEESAE